MRGPEYAYSTCSGIFSMKSVSNYGSGHSTGNALKLHIDASHNHTATISNTGSGQAFNTMPPYYVTNIWRRVA